jgi:hypothetical protein
VSVIDCVIYSYEYDALAVRMEALRGVVDVHVVVQGDRTFRGMHREVSLVPDSVVSHVVEMPVGLDPWAMERYLRDQSGALGSLIAGPGDFLIIADCDEIPHPDAVVEAQKRSHPMVCETDYREWFLDWRAPSHHLYHQPVMARPRDLVKVGGAHKARWDRPWPAARATGWHVSNLGDVVHEKLANFSHTEYDTPEYRDVEQLERRRRAGVDFLGRFDLEKTDDLPPGSHLFPSLLS